MRLSACAECGTIPASHPCPCGVCGDWRVMCPTKKNECASRIVIHRATKEEAETEWNLQNVRAA